MTDTSSTTALDERMEFIKFGEINSAIVNLDTITQQNAGMVEETTAATASLRDDVSQLVGAMAQFKTRQDPHSTSANSQEAA